MFFGLFWGDWTILIVLPAMIFALWAQMNVTSTFEKYSKEITHSGRTGADAARALLDANGLYDVGIEQVGGKLSDHYDLSVFLDIDPDLQKKRIEKRNSKELAERFYSEWIPLEKIYFSEMQVARRCDICIRVSDNWS